MEIPDSIRDAVSPVTALIAAAAGTIGYWFQHRSRHERIGSDQRKADQDQQMAIATLVSDLMSGQQIELKAEIQSLRSENKTLRTDLQELWNRFDACRRESEAQISKLQALAQTPHGLPENPNDKAVY